MAIQLKEGCFYRARDGAIVGPMINKYNQFLTYPWYGEGGNADSHSYMPDGKWYYKEPTDNDLIEEITDEDNETEIVPCF